MTDYSASPTTLRRLANNMRVQQDFIEVEYELFDAIADKWDKDRAEVRELRAALAEKQKVCDSLVAAVENNQEIDEEHCRELDAARAELEQARALAEKWAAMKYNGDLTAAVYHGCAEELAALLSAASGGAA